MHVKIRSHDHLNMMRSLCYIDQYKICRHLFYINLCQKPNYFCSIPDEEYSISYVLFLISQKKKEGQHMVSVGIQNEVRLHGAPLPKKKQKTKTIILMDAAIQTGWYHFIFLSQCIKNSTKRYWVLAHLGMSLCNHALFVVWWCRRCHYHHHHHHHLCTALSVMALIIETLYLTNICIYTPSIWT